MNLEYIVSKRLVTLFAAFLVSAVVTTVSAEEPCGDLGECKVLVEINSSDGDIGFHFLMDGDNFVSAALYNPQWKKIFAYYTRRELREQTLTETFAESSEPLCFDPSEDDDPDNDDEDFRTLEEFIDLWKEGKYKFRGVDNEGNVAKGATKLTFHLPAAPLDVEYESEEETDSDGEVDIVGEISWERGVDLGECADYRRLKRLVNRGDLPKHPKHVGVASWEVVLEPDFDDDHPKKRFNSNTFVVRIPGRAEREVEVADDYLESLPRNTPAKVEVGAIGFGDNATFTEIDEICLNDSDPDGSPGRDEDGEAALVNGCGFVVEDDDDED